MYALFAKCEFNNPLIMKLQRMSGLTGHSAGIDGDDDRRLWAVNGGAPIGVARRCCKAGNGFNKALLSGYFKAANDCSSEWRLRTEGTIVSNCAIVLFNGGRSNELCFNHHLANNRRDRDCQSQSNKGPNTRGKWGPLRLVFCGALAGVLVI